MATTLVQVAYRPVRVGWLVRGRSRNDLRDAFRLASCIWGGMASLVVDAGNAPEILDTAIRRFRADVLHPVAETDATAAAVERIRALAWPSIMGGVMRGEEPEEPGVIDLRRALRLRAVHGSGLRPVVPTWNDDDPLALIYAASFGDLTHPTLGQRQRAAFVGATGAEEATGAAVAAAFDHHDVPLRATMSGLGWMRPRFGLREVPGVFVGNATSLRDVRAYWNVRAVGTDVVFWDTNDPGGGPFRAAIEERIRAAASPEDVPEAFGWLPCYVATRGRRSRPQLPGELSALTESAAVQASVTAIAGDVGIAAWIHDGIRSLPSLAEQRVVAHTEERGEDSSRVTIELPPVAVSDSDVRSRQSLAIQVGTYADSGYLGTLKPPYLPDLNHWYRWEMSGSLDQLRVQDEAFSLITSFLAPTLELTTLRPRKILEKIFERAGITASRSLPGEAAWHLLIQFGGYGGVRVLRLPGVRKLLSSTNARSGIGRGAARGLINDGGRISQADRIWIGGDELDARRVWEFLLHRQVFLPGIEAKCPWCQHTSFYRPGDIDDDLQCPKCGRGFLLGPALEGDPVRFRMSGLLEPRPQDAGRTGPSAVADHQPAPVPVLLTLLFLSEWAGMDDASVLDTSYNLTCEGIEPSETDIVAIAYGARPETHTHLLIGECKGRGHVTEEDVRKLTAVATKLRETDGVECDVVFSTTRDAFTEDELTLFRRYYESSAEWEPLRRAPILLTARQLDFGRHSGAEDGPTLEEDRGPGFAPLVTWSTRKLMEAAPATEVEI